MINPNIINGLLKISTIGAAPDGFTVILTPVVGENDRIKLSTINGALVISGLTEEEARGFTIADNMAIIIGGKAFNALTPPEAQAVAAHPAMSEPPRLISASAAPREPKHSPPPPPELLRVAGRARLSMLEEEPGSGAFTAQFAYSRHPHPESGCQLVMNRISQTDAEGFKPGSEYLVHLSLAPPVQRDPLSAIRVPAEEAGPYAADYAMVEHEQAKRMQAIKCTGDKCMSAHEARVHAGNPGKMP